MDFKKNNGKTGWHDEFLCWAALGCVLVYVTCVSHQFCVLDFLMRHAELPAHQGTLALILNYLMPGKCQELPKH